MDWGQVAEFASGVFANVSRITVEDVFVNKFARAVGMAGLVLLTIWVIALVYNGYAQDSERAVGLRVHPKAWRRRHSL